MEKADGSVVQMRKGVLEMCVLAIINHQESYASDILNRLKDARLIVVEGTLYPILSRLKNEGRLQYRWEESSSGPPRKYYSITGAGTQLLTELKTGWAELSASVERVTDGANFQDNN